MKSGSNPISSHKNSTDESIPGRDSGLLPGGGPDLDEVGLHRGNLVRRHLEGVVLGHLDLACGKRVF